MPKDSQIKVLIVGAGEAGELVCNSIANSKGTSFSVVGFVDDDKKKTGATVCGHKVLGTLEDIQDIVKGEQVAELIICVPSGRGDVVRRVVENTLGLKVVFKILPRISEVLAQKKEKDYLQYVRRVKPEDLLGGEILKSDQAGIFKYVTCLLYTSPSPRDS